MSLNKNNSFSLYKWNGFMRISLLSFALICLSCEACVPSSSKNKMVENKPDVQIVDKDKELRYDILSSARSLIGTPYLAAGKTPKGFDCSGFSSFIMKQNNIGIGASSRTQALQGVPVNIEELKTGDLIFFGSNKVITHVGIVSENAKGKLQMIHASSSRGVIEENPLKSNYWKSRIICGRSVLN